MSFPSRLTIEQRQSIPGDAVRNSTATLNALMAELRGAIAAGQGDENESASRYQQCFLGTSLGGMSIAWIATVVVERGGPSWVTYLSLISLMLGTIAAVAFGISSTKGFLREWKSLETDMLEGASERMCLWYETITKIRDTYAADQITFAQDYITAVSSQLRSRLSYAIGALDKVGLIPLLASTALALAKFFQDGQLPFLWCTAAAIAGIFYVIALRFIGIAFTFERLAVILKHAAAEPPKSQ